MKIALISEEFVGVPDEGIKNFGLKLFHVLSHKHDVAGIYVSHKKQPNTSDKFLHIRSNRLFLNNSLCKTLRKIQPEIVIYSSSSCGNIFALLRMKIVKHYVPDAKIAIIVFQPVSYRWLERFFLPFLMPDFLLTQTLQTNSTFFFAKNKIFFIPAGVDTNKFLPVDAERKSKLRQQYGYNEHDFILLHVGHINRNRGIHRLIPLAKQNNVKVLLVGSPSTPQDDDCAMELTESGVVVLRRYFPKIYELYQLADLYIFPVVNEDACTAVPLSVLEAMSCNIPVVSTPFGGLIEMFKEHNGIHFFHDKNELIDKISILKETSLENDIRQHVLPYDWHKIGEKILETVRSNQK